ncbi:MAG: ECF-type sigma factor, partial [Rubricoccaceae bacterium]|nr:ECF-type sigma factor [Rubricoccaceae bacterium]
MDDSVHGEPTELLHALRNGDGAAVDVLFPVVYDELRAIARRHLRGERRNHTLSTTALVHEAYLKLVDQTRAVWQDRAHFCAVAAHAMRRILVDHARRPHARTPGGGPQPLPHDE